MSRQALDSYPEPAIIFLIDLYEAGSRLLLACEHNHITAEQDIFGCHAVANGDG